MKAYYYTTTIVVPRGFLKVNGLPQRLLLRHSYLKNTAARSVIKPSGTTYAKLVGVSFIYEL